MGNVTIYERGETPETPLHSRSINSRRYGVVSDLHGNSTATSAVARELTEEPRPLGFSALLVAGDVIGRFGDTNQTIEILRTYGNYNPVVVTYGNHDVHLRDDWPDRPRGREPGGEDERERLRKVVKTENRDWLNQFSPYTGGGGITMAHANPFAPNRNYAGYPREHHITKGDVTKWGTRAKGRAVITGGTHVQFAVDLNSFAGQSGVWINPGNGGKGENRCGDYAILTVAETPDGYDFEVDLRRAEFKELDRRRKEF